MTEEETRSSQAVDMRKQAEAIAHERNTRMPKNLDAMSPEETRQTLHELHVHQIELEIHNEELRRTQEQLDTERARYFDLYDLAPVGYCTLSEKGLILEANLTAATLLSETRDRLVQQPLSHFILKEDLDIYYFLRKQLSKTHSISTVQTSEPQAYELRMVKKDGTEFWAQLDAIAARGADGAPVCRIVLVDVTERKQKDEALRESERFASATLDALSAHIAILDDDGTILNVNRAWRDFARANSAGTANLSEGANYLNVCAAAHGPHSKEAAAFAVGFRSVLRGEQDEFSFEYPCHSPDEKRWFHVRVTHFPGKDKHCLVAAHENITAQKQAEEALRESELRMRSIAYSAQDAILMMDSAGLVSYWNPAAEHILGYTRTEAIGQNLHSFLVPPRYHAAHQAAFPTFRKTGQGAAVGKTLDLEARRKDGTEISVQL